MGRQGLHFSAPPGARARAASLSLLGVQPALAPRHAGAARRRNAAAAVAEVFPAVMRALIIDPALRSKGGHHYNAVLRLQRELSKFGISVSCLASAYADQEIVRDLGCKPTFTKSVYSRDYAEAGEFARNVPETGRQPSRALPFAPPVHL